MNESQSKPPRVTPADEDADSSATEDVSKAATDILRVDVIKTPWEAKLGVISFFVAAAALLVSIISSWQANAVATRAQQPVLRLYFNTEPDLDDEVGLWVTNAGPGTARIKSTTIQFREQEKHGLTWDNWELILPELDVPMDSVTGWDLAGKADTPDNKSASDDYIRGEDTLPLVVFKKNTPNYVRERAGRNLANAIFDDTLSVTIMYESLGGETFTAHLPKPWAPRINDQNPGKTSE